jgi:hypothetical protein
VESRGVVSIGGAQYTTASRIMYYSAFLKGDRNRDGYNSLSPQPRDTPVTIFKIFSNVSSPDA